MSGLKSRRKGTRVEYLVRDALRTEGFTADRVPASGASQGFKGDIHASKNGKTHIIEVKSRQGAFSKAYTLICLLHSQASEYKFAGVDLPEGSFEIAYSISDLLHPTKLLAHMTPSSPNYKLAKSVLNLKALKGTADILVLKDDRKPLLFLRFYP